MLSMGSVVAGYRIERVLGAGGMGTVYLAQNPDLARRDALKVLSGELSRSAEFRARFVREAEVASRLAHPNIVSVYSRGETEDGQLWIAMQFVEGTSADDALRSGTMTPSAQCTSLPRSARGWTTHIATTWCTAISSQETSCSPGRSATRSARCWGTSGSRAHSTTSG
jgi:serine/threonine protein kinase